MEELISDIFKQIARSGQLAPNALMQIIHRHNKGLGQASHSYSKKKILPYYLKLKQESAERLQELGIDSRFEADFIKSVQVKPRRTASGVATITVITKPWPCSSACLYCPNDVRMPKSYLSDEPACQRAELSFFDPYLQVIARLRALQHMGHPTDKIELIVLGGTWSDYPKSYQLWFVHELFRALNDGLKRASKQEQERIDFYTHIGMLQDREGLKKRFSPFQEQVNTGNCSYNEAITKIAQEFNYVSEAAHRQTASLEELVEQHKINELADHRVVGLVIETRPDLISKDALRFMRQLGCTKIQMGIQSLDERVLKLNRRNITRAQIESAFFWLRRFGFKIHVHYMLNLYGTDPASELQDYKLLVHDRRFQPDEVKLYPCVLVEGAELMRHQEDGSWRAYEDKELLQLLVEMVAETPLYTRISRMIRDISSHDIIAGNKRANLRQLVEQQFDEQENSVQEIRYREVSVDEIDLKSLRLDVSTYEAEGSKEYFLQWVTPQNKIAGFLRLSLPEDPIARPAMIREVHVYGKVAHLQEVGDGPQHSGLGRRLISQACQIAACEGYGSINVISSVGTRDYYRKLGFVDGELYQRKLL